MGLQKGISPVGKMQAPRKPWEKVTEGSTSDSTAQETDTSPSLPQDCLDSEFPPVEDEKLDGNDTQDGETVKP
jgi:hypothetical protein